MPTALINGPKFFKIRNKDFCNFLSIAMVMNSLHTFLVVYFPYPILIIYVFLTWNTFLNPKTLKKTVKNRVCSTPYKYTCVRPDVLIFSKSIIWWVYFAVPKPLLKIPSSFREIEFFLKMFLLKITRSTGVYLLNPPRFDAIVFFWCIMMSH